MSRQRKLAADLNGEDTMPKILQDPKVLAPVVLAIISVLTYLVQPTVKSVNVKFAACEKAAADAADISTLAGKGTTGTSPTAR